MRLEKKFGKTFISVNFDKFKADYFGKKSLEQNET